MAGEVAIDPGELPTDTVFDREGPGLGIPPEAIEMMKAVILCCPMVRESQEFLGKTPTEMVDVVEALRRAGLVKFTFDPESETFALEMPPDLFDGGGTKRRDKRRGRFQWRQTRSRGRR